jgi:MFS family permease
MGFLNIVILSTGLLAASFFGVWLPAALLSSRNTWIAFNVLMGAVDGTFLQLSTAVAQVVFGEEVYYSVVGPLSVLTGVGFLIGNPLGGRLVKGVPDEPLQSQDFMSVILFSGACLTVATFCSVSIRWLDARKEGWKWCR